MQHGWKDGAQLRPKFAIKPIFKKEHSKCRNKQVPSAFLDRWEGKITEIIRVKMFIFGRLHWEANEKILGRSYILPIKR